MIFEVKCEMLGELSIVNYMLLVLMTIRKKARFVKAAYKKEDDKASRELPKPVSFIGRYTTQRLLLEAMRLLCNCVYVSMKDVRLP